MLFDENKCNNFYDVLYDWLASHTPGSHLYKGTMKYYYKNIYLPVSQKIAELSTKEKLTSEEKEFLKLTSYNGPIYRIQNYRPKKKGYICETEFYQAWSKSTQGLSTVTNLNGEILLIIGDAKNGIDIFGLLTYLLKYKCVNKFNAWKDPKNLLRYEGEEEIAYPMRMKNIEKVVIVNKKHLLDWENNIVKTIEKDEILRYDFN